MGVTKGSNDANRSESLKATQVQYVHAGSLINLNGAFLTVGFQAIRVFDPVAKNYSVVGYTDRARFDPTLVTLGNGNVLVLGGS